MRVLGLIPARGGSKGVPRKNIRKVADEPLIAYAIRAAAESRELDDFITTTDDEEIAALAERLGSKVLPRPAHLAHDNAPMVPVLVHALSTTEESSGTHYDAVVLLQPTSPIRSGADVDEVVRILEQDGEADCVISVCEMNDLHPARMYRLEDAGALSPLDPELEDRQRQQLPPVYYRNGALYAARRTLLIDQRKLIGGKRRAYVMPRRWLTNIDEEIDLLVADLLLRRWKKGSL